MKLLTKALKKKLPKLRATEPTPLKDKIAQFKLFDPCGAYTFYCVEGQEDDGDFLMWGWATLGDPNCAEFGYVSLNEVSAVRNRFNLGIERDLYFDPTPLKDIPEIRLYDTEPDDL